VADRHTVKPGHLLFGLAFASIGIAWLVEGGGSVVDAVWLVALIAAALGLAALGAAVAWLVR